MRGDLAFPTSVSTNGSTHPSASKRKIIVQETINNVILLSVMADRKIDVHAHFVPEVYRQALLDNGITNPDGMPGIPAWSVEAHLEYMNVSLFTQARYIWSQPKTGHGLGN